MTCLESSIALMEQSLILIEERYLSNLYGEPWCFLTMCAAIKLLNIKVSTESRDTAKAACAKGFLDLHCKHNERYQALLSSLHLSEERASFSPIRVSVPLIISYQMVGPRCRNNEAYSPLQNLTTCNNVSAPMLSAFPTSEWFDNNYDQMVSEHL